MKESPYKDIACKWLFKAIEDLEVAEETLQNHPGISAFQSQQAVEKALKATIITMGIRPPKTHRIELLVEIIARNNIDTSKLEELKPETLTDYAVEARYPDFGEEPTREEVEEALRVAKRTLEGSGSSFP